METQADQKVAGNFHKTVTLMHGKVNIRRRYSIGRSEGPDKCKVGPGGNKDNNLQDNKSNISKHLKCNSSVKLSTEKNQGCVEKHDVVGKSGFNNSVGNPESDQNNNSLTPAPIKGNSKGHFNIKIRQGIPKSFANKGLHIFLNKSYTWPRVDKVEFPIQRSQTLINYPGPSNEHKTSEKKTALEPIKSRRKLVIRKLTLVKERNPLVELPINTRGPMTLPPLQAPTGGDTAQGERRQAREGVTEGRDAEGRHAEESSLEGRHFTRRRSQSFDAGLPHGSNVNQQEVLTQYQNTGSRSNNITQTLTTQPGETLIPYTPRKRTKKIKIYQTESPSIHNTNYQGQVIERLYGLSARDSHQITTQDRVEKFMTDERNKEGEESDNMSLQVCYV